MLCDLNFQAEPKKDVTHQYFYHCLPEITHLTIWTHLSFLRYSSKRIFIILWHDGDCFNKLKQLPFWVILTVPIICHNNPWRIKIYNFYIDSLMMRWNYLIDQKIAYNAFVRGELIKWNFTEAIEMQGAHPQWDSIDSLLLMLQSYDLFIHTYIVMDY